ncbi:hypothetical protein H0H93_002676 [Arthromyces matolae]|nr:hypothetical protein H0H93_002676 [Arthromyces matolae]
MTSLSFSAYTTVDNFLEEHSKSFLSKEWLAKSDSKTSTPYLFKFYSNTVDLSCGIILTDTRTVWAEVMTSAQFARRWRNCNDTTSSPYAEASEEEDSWRIESLELLSRAHKLGAIDSASFELVQTNYSDIAFELGYDGFKWRWETCFLGHKASSEIISKHLIFPLISVNHLAFSSSQAISDMSDLDMEKAVDKVGRTARRSVDTHIKNAISKPRMSTTLCRMAAMFNFAPDLPPVISASEEVDLEVKPPKQPEPPVKSRPNISVTPPDEGIQASDLSNHGVHNPSNPPVPDNEDSATEESDGDDNVMNEVNQNRLSAKPSSSAEQRPGSRSSPAPRLSPPQIIPNKSEKHESDSDSAPPRPPKKLKQVSKAVSSDDDSEDGGNRKSTVKRGTRQPIKRGGKRF